MLNHNKSTLLSFVLILMLLFGQTSVYAISYTDTSDHWASKEIQKWSAQGLLQGNEGKFNPDNNINRAEMAIILDRLMDYQEKGNNDFTDLDNNWYTEAILKNIGAGTIVPDAKTVKPMEVISRQEAVAMFARALGIEKVEGSTSFLDDSSISSEYKGYVKAFCDNGYINGMPDGTFAPTAPLTRATVVKIVDNMLAAWITETGTYTEDYAGSVVINTKGVTLKDLTIGGNLIIAEGVGEGEIHLDNVVIKGDMKVRGGGENSVYMKSTTVSGTLRIDKENGKLRIVASGSTTIKLTRLTSGVILVEDNLRGKGFEKLIIAHDASKDGEISLEGDFDEVDVNAGIDIELKENSTVDNLDINGNVSINSNGKIKSMNLLDNTSELHIKGEGKVTSFNVKSDDTEISIDKKVIIDKVNVENEKVSIDCKGTIKEVTTSKDASNMSLTGTGSIKKVNIKADDSTVDTKGTTIKVSKGVSGTKADGDSIKGGRTETNSGKPTTGDTSVINKPSTGGGSGGSGGGGSSPTPPSDRDLVSAAKASLSLDIDLDKVSDHMYLPSSEENVLISWVSSNTDIIKDNGTVSRPAFGTGNANVTLTATLTKGSISMEKNFDITVLEMGKPASDISYDQISSDGYPASEGVKDKHVIQIGGQVTEPNTEIEFRYTFEKTGEEIILMYTTKPLGDISLDSYVVSPTEVVAGLVSYFNDNITSDDLVIYAQEDELVIETKVPREGGFDEYVFIGNGLSKMSMPDKGVSGRNPEGGYQKHYTYFGGIINNDIIVYIVYVIDGVEYKSKDTIFKDGSANFTPLLDNIENDYILNNIPGYTLEINQLDRGLVLTSDTINSNKDIELKIDYELLPTKDLANSIIPKNMGVNNTTTVQLSGIPSYCNAYIGAEGISDLSEAIIVNPESSIVDLSKYNEGDEFYLYITNSTNDISNLNHAVRSDFTITIDNEAPTLTPKSEPYSIPIESNITPLDKVICSDTLDNDVSIEWIIRLVNDGEPEIVDDLSEIGKYSIDYTATDWAGNTSEASIDFMIVDDYISHESLSDIDVSINTRLEDIDFPDVFVVNLKNAGKLPNIISDNQEWTCANYNPNEVGSYVFALDNVVLSDYIKDPSNSFDGTIHVTVNVEDNGVSYIKTINSAPKVIAKNTSSDEINFPDKCFIRLSNGDLREINLSENKWSSEDFDTTTVGEYSFSSEITLPNDVDNKFNKDVTATSIVHVVESENDICTVSFDTSNVDFDMEDVQLIKNRTTLEIFLARFGTNLKLYLDKDKTTEFGYWKSFSDDATVYVHLEEPSEFKSADINYNYRDSRFADGYPKIVCNGKSSDIVIKLKSSDEAIVSVVSPRMPVNTQSVIDGHDGIKTPMQTFHDHILISDTDEHTIMSYNYDAACYYTFGLTIEQNKTTSEYPTLIKPRQIITVTAYNNEVTTFKSEIDTISVSSDYNTILLSPQYKSTYDQSTIDYDDFSIDGVTINNAEIYSTVKSLFPGIKLSVDGLTPDNYKEKLLTLNLDEASLRTNEGRDIKYTISDPEILLISDFDIESILFSEDNKYMGIKYMSFNYISSVTEFNKYYNDLLLELELIKLGSIRNPIAYFKVLNYEDIIHSESNKLIDKDLSLVTGKKVTFNSNLIEKYPYPTVTEATYNIDSNELEFKIYNTLSSSSIDIFDYVIEVDDIEYRLYGNLSGTINTETGNRSSTFTNDNIRFSINKDSKVRLRYKAKQPSETDLFGIVHNPLPASEWIDVEVVE